MRKGGKIDRTGPNSPSVEDESLIRHIAQAVRARGTTLSPANRRGRTRRAKADAKDYATRLGLVEPPESDPNGFERIIGESDLLSINFLDRGRRSADAVCRISLPMDGGHAYGTGFLIGPRLLITNNHVLASPAEAAQSSAEFGYEHDLDGVLRDPAVFNLDPNSLFITSTELDATLVAIAPLATNGTPADRYGWLPLIPTTGKVLDGEWVSIIQHPSGQPKQIAIHASEVLKIAPPAGSAATFENFLHYSTDTEPGSSGSPVFNDQWQVVALHHKAVPAPNAKPGDPVQWIANEGVRISAIFRWLEQIRFEDTNARAALDQIGRSLGFAPLAEPAVSAASLWPTEQFAPFKATHWADPALGYDEKFLTTPIALEPIYAKLAKAGKVAKLIDSQDHELKYFHFSAVLHAERHFPLMTAVNIDGLNVVHPGKRKDSWRQDARIGSEYQPDDDFYVSTRAEEKVYFSRGHLVRLLDPCWSHATDPEQRTADARRGMEDSFHFTNAAPQVQAYNDQDWGNLEDYVLDKAQTSQRRLTVFTGPIFRERDPYYGRQRKGGPWQIPLSFWKIAVLQKTDKVIAAAGFIVGQTEYVRALYEAKVFSGLKPYTIDEIRSRKIQTTIATIENQTGLDFGALKKFDSHGSLESTRQTRWLNRLEDISI
ncbi:DNA/RNA non-specific endonuclease [Sphingomonas sp.]|uniref:DNA/RNA non-specific endonuclease n=1 Tax=Sphingomonas sp. TaxID=28214 RepID=UPI001B1D7DC0|nr:DNA/RNA non-specific endonuclease [Sphingomonas sp.]MBO9713064.1 DNA/RNA non-specific endonuclease [Sphingomonas sp.]